MGEMTNTAKLFLTFAWVRGPRDVSLLSCVLSFYDTVRRRCFMTRARYVAQLTGRCAIQDQALRRYVFEY